MAQRESIVSFLNATLKIGAISDHSHNGVQVEGSDQIVRVGCAVDACMAVYKKAADARCQMVIAHHGLIWGGLPAVTGKYKNHISFLLEHKITLYAAHLPLDLHPRLGNNILLAKCLNLQSIQKFGNYKGTMIGFKGRLPRPLSIKRLTSQLAVPLKASPTVLPFGPSKISRVAIVSGGGGDELHEAIADGCDCYITGEPVHHNHHEALEAGIHVIYLGHYASEILGVKAVGSLLEKKFGIEWIFLDVPTTI